MCINNQLEKRKILMRMIVLEKSYKFKINLLLSTNLINFLNLEEIGN